MYDTVIVTRHKATVLWLKENGITGKVVKRITNPEMLRGKIVIGNLPPYLMAYAKLNKVVSFTVLPESKRGVELTLDDMYRYGAYLKSYVVFTDELAELISKQKGDL